MEIYYLTVQDVEELHQEALNAYGGLPGRTIGKLEATLSLPNSGFGNFDRYLTIFEKAACYLY